MAQVQYIKDLYENEEKSLQGNIPHHGSQL